MIGGDLPEGAIVIRPSSLSNWHDCPKRGAARLWPRLIDERGFTLHPSPPSHIGAAVGTGAHAALAYQLGGKIEAGALRPLDEAEDAGVEGLRRAIDEDGVAWDDVTPTLGVAEQQVVRVSRTYRRHLLETIEPVEIETRMAADLGDGWYLAGRPDFREATAIGDLKTGAQARINSPQYGAYSILSRSHQHRIDELREHFVPRVSLKKAQPEPSVNVYAAHVAEQQAWALIRSIRRDFGAFLETGNPFALPENPNSVLCAAKWCRAHGTPFCSATHGTRGGPAS